MPTFQPQNPAINGYALGWSSCTSYSAAMVASFDRQVPKVVTGRQVREMTHDTSGGLTLAQVDKALLDGWDINLDTTYSLPWSDFVAKINAGRAAILQGWYAPIADSRFDAGHGFRQNHAIAVMPGFVGMDPLADGRYADVYKYFGESYPQSLLREFAGRLNIGGTSYRALGLGLVYASFSADRVGHYRVSVKPLTGQTRRTFRVYSVSGSSVTASHLETTGGFEAACTAPRMYSWPGHSSQSLVRITSGSRTGKYIPRKYAHEVFP